MIWLRDLGFINMLMAASMWDIGIKISNMGLERKSGMTLVCIKDSIKMLLRKDKENIAGLMEIGILENGAKICSMEEDSLFGMMKDFSLEIGKTI